MGIIISVVWKELLSGEGLHLPRRLERGLDRGWDYEVVAGWSRGWTDGWHWTVGECAAGWADWSETPEGRESGRGFKFLIVWLELGRWVGHHWVWWVGSIRRLMWCCLDRWVGIIGGVWKELER